MPPPSSLATTMVRSGRGSSGPSSRPPESCRNVRSPSRANALFPCPRAAPIAVETVPSMPATPRFASTRTPGAGNPVSAASRTGLDEPSTSRSPSDSARTSARATCSPVVAPGSSSTACTRDTARSDASAQACDHPAGEAPLVSSRVPTEVAVAATSVHPAPGPTTCTGTPAPSSRATSRCRVGRPSTSTCAGSSDPRASGCTGCAGAGAPGSATVGRSRAATLPAPATTRVGTETSTWTGASTVTGTTRVHGPPSGRPVGNPAPSGTSGSARGTSSCTGPGSPVRAPVAAASPRHTAVRHRAGSSPPSTTAVRTAPPNNPRWSTVWLAPEPSSSPGRSAESTSSGTPACDASSTAGCRFATAVPEVVTTGTGTPLARASPRARKPAERSSIRTCSRSRPAVSAACRA